MKRATIRKALSALAVTPVLVASAGLAWAGGAINHVRDVRVRTTDGEQGPTEIEVVGTAAPSYNVRVEDGGKRLLVDLGNADLVGQPSPVTRPVGVVAGLLTQSFAPSGTGPGSTAAMTRLSVNLARNATFRMKAEGNVLRIVLVPGAVTEAAAGRAPGGAAGAAASVNAAPATDAKGSSTLLDVAFRRDKSCASLCDRIELRTTRAPAYAIGTTSTGKLRLELKRTTASADALKSLDLAAHGGSLRTATVVRDEAAGSVFVDLDREGSAQGVLSIEGETLVWAFDLPEGGARRASRKGPKSSTVAREEDHDAGPRPTQTYGEGVEIEVGEGRAAGFASATSGVRAQAAGRYAGRRIDLDLKDADIHNVLRLLADVGKVNVVTADDVTGNVTIRMRNVPWDQALDVVLQAKGLGMVRQGNLIRVAPMAQLQRERELKLAAAKQEYELTPLETRLIPVSYAQADELSARAKDLLSPRGSIAVDERTNVLIARDISGNLNNVEELVRSLDTQTPQVLVEARIVEATSRYVRDIGIQWGGDATFSEATGNPTGIAFPSRASVAGGNYDPQTPTAGISPAQRQVATPNFAVNLPAAVGTGQGGALGFSLGSVDNNFNLGIRLSAAEASGLLRIVSSPRVLTLDNREARISQGTLIPFSQISAQGVQTTFQEAKLQLLVRPHVTADGSVSMHVKLNRDEPDFNQTSARGDPTILKREAETDLLVQDGHTAVIGGIYTRNTGKNVDQVPFFGDIPILGVLFQRRRASDTRSELVIFLTPRIVNRAEALGR